MLLLPSASSLPVVAAVQTPTVELQTHLNLKPGDYELRAAVMDGVRGVTASVFSQIVIPAFPDAPLSLSDHLCPLVSCRPS